MQIRIRKINDSDLQTRVDWINHPTISEMMYFDLPATYQKTYQWYKQLESRSNRIDLVALSDQTSLSMFGLTEIDKQNSKAELYIMINPEYQGKGYGKKFTKWLLNFGFLEYDLNKIYLFTDLSNQAATNLYKAIGFYQEGILRSDKLKNGKLNDRLVMSMMRSEWESQTWMRDKIDFYIDGN